jgi:nitric oxide reductase subunit B
VHRAAAIYAGHLNRRNMKKLWIAFAIVFFGSFAVLGWIGTRIFQEMPPIPAQVVDSGGRVVVAEGDIARGQNVWQALGGMEVGSIWGHGSYARLDGRLAAPRSHLRTG